MKRSEGWDTGLVRNFKNSLNAKVFLYIASLLIFTSLIIYGIVMIVMPNTYKAELSGQFTQNLTQLIVQLKNSSYEQSSDIIYNFCISNHASVTLESNTTKVNYGAFIEGATSSKVVISADTTFHFKNSDELYTLKATVSAQPVNQMTTLFIKLLPWIILLILLIASVGALFCSRFLTKPIIEISVISKKMSSLDMTWRCDIVRSDEIGVLAESLNTLAQNLDTALTDLKSANNKLQEDIEWERKQEKQRRDFFAAVSHELKTPITIIKGELEGMIQNIGIYKNRDQYLRHSLKTAMTMENLVQEILSVTKMEVDGFTLDLKEVDLSRVVDTCYQQIAGIAEDKSIHVDTSIEKNVMIRADKKLLSKVVSNVMNNAVFHSPVGALIQMELSTQKGTVIFTVENSGVHIEQDDMDQLFTPFYRTDKSHNRQSGGSGLGLYITKTILNLHKAMYKIENTENGVKFTICFRRL